MRIIDRYLLWQFLQTFAICFMSLTGLYVVFDLFTNLEEFLRCSDKAGGLWSLIAAYYSTQSILFFDRTSALLTLIAAMFTVTWIQRSNELTALMAAGVSRARVVAPVLAASAVVALLAAANREVVIPMFREALSRKTTNLVGDKGQPVEPCYDAKTNILLGGRMAFADHKRIDKANFVLPGAMDAFGGQLSAENAFYQPKNDAHPSGYLLDEVNDPPKIDELAGVQLGGEPIIVTHHDRPDWIEAGQCFVVSDVEFDQLTGGHGWRQFSSTFTLVRGLHNESLDLGPDVRVAVHSRLTQPLLDFTLLFLGLPLVLSRQQRNVFVAIGLCVVMMAIFMIVGLAFQHLGSIYLISPALAAWAPVMLFIPLAVYLSEALWQ